MNTEEFSALNREGKSNALLALREKLKGTPSADGNAQAGGLHPTLVHAPVNERSDFPLTDLQVAYFVGKMTAANDSVGCHTYLEFPVMNLDLPRLEAAWVRLLHHHPMLRVDIGKNGRQRIPAELPPTSFVVHDLRESAETLAEHLSSVRRELSHKVYRPGDWPLYEIRVTHVDDQQSRLHVSMDSWMVDGKSAGMIHGEWKALYENPSMELPEAGMTFRDFVYSMEAFKGSRGYEKCVDYWANKLSDFPKAPDLPYRPETAVATLERSRLSWDLSPALWLQLKSWLKAEGVSPTAMLLTLLSEEVRAWTTRDRFGVVMTMFNRPAMHAQIGRVVGPFTSTGLFVADFASAQSFLERMQGSQRQVWQDLDHGYVSGVKALRMAAKDREDRAPEPIPVVFTSMLATEDSAAGSSWLDDADYGLAQTPHVYLHAQAIERKGTLRVVWDVADGRFQPGVTAAMFDRFCRTLEELGRDRQLWHERDYDRMLKQHHLDRIALHQNLEEQSFEQQAFPLTPLQQSYIVQRVLNRDQPLSAVYRAFDVEQFQYERLELAVRRMMERSPMLAVSVEQNGRGRIPSPIPTCPIPVDDWTALDAEAQAHRQTLTLQEMQAEMQAELKREQSSLRFAIRVSLLEGAKAKVHTLLDMTAFDGYSTWIFYRDLLGTGSDALPEAMRTQLSFEQYAHARHSYRRSPGYQGDQAYWERKFADLPEGPQWRWLDQVAVSEKSTHTTRYAGQLDNWGILQEKAQAMGVSAEAVLITIFMEAIRRQCRNDRITVLCAEYPHRELSHELAESFGDFTIFSWVSDDEERTASFAKQVLRAQRQLERDRLHSWGNPLEAMRTRAAAQERLPSFAAVITNCLQAPAELPEGVSVSEARSFTPGVDIDHVVYQRGTALHFHWEVRVDRVLAVEAKRMFAEYCKLLDMIVTEQDWEELRLQPTHGSAVISSRLSPDEFEKVVYRWNQTDADYDRSQCVHALFEKQALEHPQRLAVLTDDVELTYGELNRRANQLAHHLHNQGVGPGALVGILLDRSEDMVVSLLAVLKAGGAYVPLNTADPKERLQAIVQSAGIRFVICKERFAELLTDAGVYTIQLDRARDAIATEPGDQPSQTAVTSDDVAYVIFTSGSTGTPKGVVVKHRPVINLIEWAQKTFAFDHNDRVLFVNQLSFDLSVFDLLALLAYGGSIRLVRDEDRTNAARVARLLCEEPITFWNSAPAYLQLLLPFLKLNRPVNDVFRLAFLSGDWIPLDLADELRSVFPSVEVIGLGGATEATVWSNFFPIGKLEPGWKSVPYGRPIQNARYYILDDELQPCPVGEPGQLYIGGECLSEGYLNAPQLTASSFVPDPFHERPHMIMYRTGDLARFYEDGNMEFLGRSDHQVKVRGHRIELGELEVALAKAGLEQAVVVARKDNTNSLYLVAFGLYQGRQGLIHEDSLWSRLRALVPEYMVPSQMVALQAIPITINGKVDRKRLMEMQVADIVREDSQEPRGGSDMTSLKEVATAVQTQADAGQQLEERLLGFVREQVADILAIGEDEVELDSNIGHLGFNSLHYTLLGARIMEQLQVEINPALFFRYNSCRQVVEFLLDSYQAQLLGAAGNDVGHDEVLDAGTPAVHQPMYQSASQETEALADDQIAIVGMYGIMPQAENLEAFWQNVLHGIDCIEWIPFDRWDWRAYDGDPTGPTNVTNVKMAGFMRHVDRFDAAFFGISPREAKLMDPRQRLLMEGVWKTIEDAGYKASELSGQPVGFFVGATGDEYAMLMQQADLPIDQYTLMGVSRTLLTNRINYYFDWSGPSEVIDTACSSSLVAVHRAVQAIRNGECRMAIAGGINVMIDPMPHISLSKVGMLSPDGHCKTFDASADGYGRGEGLGLLLLKPLKEAQADRDHIYAVIKGTAINHGGKANALTSPNPKAQSELLLKAYRTAGVDPNQVGYIETHGTGTPLGDPIEIEALKEAFSTLYQERGSRLPDQPSIGLGAVKALVGHLESAAGIAGLMKLILAMRHQVLPPMKHLRTLNPRIRLEQTPFYLVQDAKKWEAAHDRHGVTLPRVGGVSSFGFGGVNAHVVVEEHLQTARPRAKETGRAYLIPLSGRDEERLIEYAKSLAGHLRQSVSTGAIAFADVAFTLQRGREEMNERLAIVADSIEQLVERLDDFANGSRAAAGIYRGNARKDREKIQYLLAEQDELFDSLFSDRQWDKLARLWVFGMKVDWKRVDYGGESPSRVPLPGYPFEPARYWIESLRRKKPSVWSMLRRHENRDKPDCTLELSGEEFFLADHVVNGSKVMPAAAYLEMIHATVLGDGPITGTARIRNVVWSTPILADDGVIKTVHIRSERKGDDLRVTVAETEHREKGVDNCTATLSWGKSTGVPESLDLTALQQKLPMRRKGDDCYAMLKELGIEYGPGFRVLETMWHDETEALSYIELPPHLEGASERNPLHPSLVDGALQTTLLLQLFGVAEGKVFLPFGVEEVVMFGPIPQQCCVHVKWSGKQSVSEAKIARHDITITDRDGRVALLMRGCTARPLRNAAPQIAPQTRTASPLHYYVEGWKDITRHESVVQSDASAARYLLLGAPKVVQQALEERGGAVVRIDSSQARETEWGTLFKQMKQAGELPNRIVFWLDVQLLEGLAVEEQLEVGFESLFDLTKELIRVKRSHPITLIVCGYSTDRRSAVPAVEALPGFGQTVRLENPRLPFKYLAVQGEGSMSLQQAEWLGDKFDEVVESDKHLAQHRVDLVTGAHQAKQWFAWQADEKQRGQLPIREGGIYLITGGSGRIALHLAQALVRRNARIVLMGRSPLNHEQSQILSELNRSGGLVEYHQADVMDKQQVKMRLADIRTRWGALNGIFHCAGTTQDSLLLLKTKEQARQTLAAKVLGTVVLDKLTRQEPLEFFVLFSSMAAANGNVGQSDYVFANRFMDRFATKRRLLCENGLRQGITLSIGWPLWQDGGMTVPPHEFADMQEKMGMTPIGTEEALGVLLDRSLPPHDHFLVSAGDGDKLDAYLQVDRSAKLPTGRVGELFHASK